MRVAALATCIIATCVSSARADDPPRPDLVFVANPNFGIEPGARTTLNAGRLLFRYQELLPSITKFDESRPSGKALGILGRTLQFGFLDGPLAHMETTVTHELFGHGARAREFGGKPAYVFGLPLPYSLFLAPQQQTSGVAFYNTDPRNLDQDIALHFGGLESNFLTAHWINTEMVNARGWARHSDLLVYAISKVTYVTTFVSRDLRGQRGAVGDDIDSYVNALQDKFNHWRPNQRVTIAKNLQTAYLWNLIDPTLVFSLYSTLVNFIYHGKRESKMPLPSVNGVTFYPSPRFNLSPFGAEHYLDLFLTKGDVVVDAYGRIGSSGLASYTGAGVRALGWKPHKSVSLGAEVDVWKQPALQLEERNLYTRPDEWGVNVGGFATVKILGKLGLTGKFAYKSRGYLQGQPLDATPYGYLGVSIAP